MIATITTNHIDDFKSCRGDAAKQALVTKYFIAPVCGFRLLDRQKKRGCCGDLTENYYLFSYQSTKDKSISGTFLVGAVCAKEFLLIVNKIRAQYNLNEYDFTHYFDASIGNIGKTYSLKDEMRDLLLLISILWDKPLYGKMLYLLKALIYDWNITIIDDDILFLSRSLSKDGHFKYGSVTDLQGLLDKHRQRGLPIGRFAFKRITRRLKEYDVSIIG